LNSNTAEMTKASWQRWGAALGIMAVALSAASVVATIVIGKVTKGRTYSDVREIPHRHVGLVLGCSKQLSDGRPNLFFRNRMIAAAELYRAGKVDYLLVSGDNHVRAYDEATDMRNALIQSGVPPERIYCDFAGFRTLDSVVRSKEVFGQKEVTIISQEFHNQRAIFIAAHCGLDAIGFNAPEVNAYDSFKTRCREQLAKVSTLVDVLVLRRRPRFLGEKVAIGAAPQSSVIAY
jgi:SanA protein